MRRGEETDSVALRAANGGFRRSSCDKCEATRNSLSRLVSPNMYRRLRTVPSLSLSRVGERGKLRSERMGEDVRVRAVDAGFGEFIIENALLHDAVADVWATRSLMRGICSTGRNLSLRAMFPSGSEFLCRIPVLMGFCCHVFSTDTLDGGSRCQFPRASGLRHTTRRVGLDSGNLCRRGPRPRPVPVLRRTTCPGLPSRSPPATTCRLRISP